MSTTSVTNERPASTMPAVFIGHGSPMNTLEHNRYTQAWHDAGRAAPRPRAILAISAHWYINTTAVTAMPRPRTIHDFSGFPKRLSEFDYPAPGAPDVAAEVAELAKPTRVGMDAATWGLDHGTWSVLAHMFPDADIPVVQLSIDASKRFDEHVQLGAALATLRDQGVLIMASGNVVHHLGRIDWSDAEGGAAWNREFDEAARVAMADDPGSVASLQRHRHFRAAAPTPDHFVPLLYLAGVAASAGRSAEVLVGGYAYGSLSMTSYIVH